MTGRIGDFTVEPIEDLQKFLEEIPYTPAPSMKTPEELDTYRVYMNRLRKSVADDKRGLMSREIYQHERLLAFHAKDLGDEIATMTPMAALEKATQVYSKQMEQIWIQIAEALEARQSYKYRLF